MVLKTIRGLLESGRFTKVLLYIRLITNGLDVKLSGLEGVYLKYHVHALTACELPC